LLVLLGIPILVIGFVVGLNPLLVVAIAGFATGLLAGLDPLAILGSRHRTGRIARFAARTGNTVRLRLPSTDRQRRRGAA